MQNAESKGKATHTVTVIRANGQREQVLQRELTAEETDALFGQIKKEVEDKKHG